MPLRNRELLAETCSERLLSSVEQQRRHILRLHVQKQPCPSCGVRQNVFEATGVEIDDYDFGASREKPGTCVGCGRGLRHVVLFVSMGGPGWVWSPVSQEPAHGA